LALVEEKTAAPITIKAAAEMTNAVFMLHLLSPTWLFEREEQYPSYKHNGIAEITPRACGFAIYNYARGQRRCA
jgi:hypothetical protein